MRKKFLATFCLAMIIVLTFALVACEGTQTETYTVSFSGTDSAINSISVKAGEVPNIPSVPEKAGYSGAWTLDGNPYSSKAFDYGKDIELVAKYTLLTYNVVFKADGKQVGETQTYTVESKNITAPAVPAKEGYTGAWEKYELTTGDKTVNAVYTAIAYNVVFKADGVQVGKTQTYTVTNKNITAPAVPAKDGYTGAWEKYELTTGDVTVNAVYTAIVYNVVFKADGKQVGETQTYTVESKNVTAPDVPAKAGYTGAWEKYELTTGDVTVNAVYTAIAYNVVFKADGVQVGETQTYTVANKNVTAPAVPAKDGYTGAWEKYELTTGDVTVNAVYTATIYNVVFKADGVQVGETQTYTVESKNITAPAVPAKDGYTGAWEKYELTTGDKTVNAVYTANTNTKYTVEHYFENVDGTYAINAEKTQELQGTTDTTATATALVVDHYTENAEHADRVASGNINGNGTLVLKLYYKLDTVNVTFDYGTTQDDTVVTVKYGATVSDNSAVVDAKYPYALAEWQKNGTTYNFESAVVENITLNAVYENEAVFDDFEAEASWKLTATATKSYVTSGVISGTQSMQFVTTSDYNGIYRQNLDDTVDFSDVNYVYFKVRVSTAAKITLRFFNENTGNGKNYKQLGQDIKADGAWHLICVDMSALSAATTDFDKTAIKSMLVMSSVAATVEIDDITFVKDNSSIKGAVACYDFEDQNGWKTSGNSSTNTMAYVTEGALSGNQSLQVTATGYNGPFNQNINSTEFANVNYVYVKVKTTAKVTISMRLYSGIGIGDNYVKLTGSSVAADGEYHIVKFDISNWSGLTAAGTAFEKSGTKTLIIMTSAAATLTVDDVILSTSELNIK